MTAQPGETSAGNSPAPHDRPSRKRERKRKLTVQRKRGGQPGPRVSRRGLGKRTDAAAAKRLGITRGAARMRRVRAGIPAIPKFRQWTEEELAILAGDSSLREAAAMLGCSPETVRQWRLKNRPETSGADS